jgi:hypothetical protein
MANRPSASSARVVVPEIEGLEALYEVELTAAPSPYWRAAFLRRPSRLTSRNYTPDIGRLEIRGTTLHFRADPEIDRWIAYANSIVEQ